MIHTIYISYITKMHISLNIHKNPDDILWTYHQKPEVFAKYTQYMPIPSIPTPVPIVPTSVPIVPTPTQIQTQIQPPKQTRKCKKPTPMEIIIQLSENSHINADYIKQSLIDFISKKEFHKAFAVKRTSEIMQAISENKFNKSMALFISFMFNVCFVYLNKDVTYYPDSISQQQKIVI